jgi:hypothetical protein
MNIARIRSELVRIRRQIRAGNDSELWVWVLPGRLACAQRPLRDHPKFGGRAPLTAEARPLVEVWVDRVVQGGFRSVISLLETAQLDRYYSRGGINLHPNGLLGYYESRGLNVESIPCTDYQRPSADQLSQALRIFERLPKPVLLHCSAGIDRTAPVAIYIAEHDAQTPNTPIETDAKRTRGSSPRRSADRGPHQ